MNKENWDTLQEYLPLFSELNLDMSFLYITETGYTKGIIDATIPVRNFLRKNNLHDYEIQGQGQKENGVELQTQMILHDSTVELTASLYRPKTKKGDPRIWFRRIKKYCDADSFIALASDKKQLYILNLTDETVKNSLTTKGYVYQELLKLSQEKESIARELYNKIKDIHNKGFIPTVVSGDTGVGMTLEHELEIPPNSYANPDYKGIELKASRKKIKNKTRNVLFNKAPDWDNSPCKSTRDILDKYGYYSEEKDRMQLYCTIYALKPNPQGLYLDIDNNESTLKVMHTNDGEVVEWDLEYLKELLLNKHAETFWVEAESKFIDDVEHFQYNKIIHTRQPNVNFITSLIMSNIITLDFGMHIKPNGSPYWRLFALKIHKDNLNRLFPEPKEYDLTTQ